MIRNKIKSLNGPYFAIFPTKGKIGSIALVVYEPSALLKLEYGFVRVFLRGLEELLSLLHPWCRS